MKVPIDRVLKGRATETIFEEMFGNNKRFRVLHFGFEYVSPELTQALRDKEDDTFKMISKTPDFLLYDLEVGRLHLVEAKYRTVVKEKELLEIALELQKNNWGLARLFVASPQGFYFDDISNIIHKNGGCNKLSEKIISKKRQESHLKGLTALFEK